MSIKPQVILDKTVNWAMFMKDSYPARDMVIYSTETCVVFLVPTSNQRKRLRFSSSQDIYWLTRDLFNHADTRGWCKGQYGKRKSESSGSRAKN